MDWNEAVLKAFDEISKRYNMQTIPEAKPWNCEVLGSCCVGMDWIFFMRSKDPVKLFIEVIPWDPTTQITHTEYEGALENKEAEQRAWQDLVRQFAKGRNMLVDEADMPDFVYDGETAWNADVARYLRADLQYGRFGTVPPWEDPIYRGSKLGPRGRRGY